MSNESSRASLLPLPSCPGLSETMPILPFYQGKSPRIRGNPA
jgi:hypothetical protein